jgi:P-type E1-E2 ATPase
VARSTPKYENGETQVIPGAGVVWRAEQGRTIRVGTRAFLEAQGVAGVGAVNRRSTVAHVAVNDAWIGTLVVADPVRPEARAAIADLRALGLRVALVSGDSLAATENVASQVGIAEVRAACSPDEKAAVVAAAQGTGDVVAFVGDGLNDGPALAAADVGVAVSGATDMASAAAGVTLRAGGVERLVEALELARATRRTMRQNLGWAIGYNALAIPFAAAGLVPPSVAALAMAASSLSVIANSMRLAAGRRNQSGMVAAKM